MGSAITGWGMAVPDGVLDNAELADRLDVTQDWIVERTGVRRRRIAGSGDTASTLTTRAAVAALERAALDAADLDYVILATLTPDYQMPSAACLVQSALGARRAAAYDLNAGCSGWLYALAQANSLVESGAAQRVLVAGADVLSRVTDYSDKRSCVLFGDGAGVVVIEQAEGESRIGPFVLRADGSEPELLYIPQDTGLISMQGRKVYARAVDAMASSVSSIIAGAGIAPEDVGLVIAHQANARILKAVAERLGFDPDKVFCNIDRYGNTSAASIPIALTEAHEAGLIVDGDVIVVTAFGAGFAWGAGIVRWGVPVVAPAAEAQEVARV